MKAYDSKRRCSKCGSDDVSTRLLTECGQNRLRRACLRCNHTWDEAPLDYEADKELAEMLKHKDRVKTTDKAFAGIGGGWHLCDIIK